MRHDFERYVLSLTEQNEKLNKTLEEINKQIEDGLISEESASSIRSYCEVMHNNYQRVLYCKYLYDLPPKFIQKINNKLFELKSKKFIEEHNDKDSVLAENQEALDKLEEVVDAGSNES